MKKERLPLPNENVWKEEERWHICHFLTCEDGCDCESHMFTIGKLKEIVNAIEINEYDTTGMVCATHGKERKIGCVTCDRIFHNGFHCKEGCNYCAGYPEKTIKEKQMIEKECKTCGKTFLYPKAVGEFQLVPNNCDDCFKNKTRKELL